MVQTQGKLNWIRRFEHWVLRLCSFGLSLVSANSVLWFYSSMDHIPGAVFFQPYVKWVLAIVVALFGYFANRGLAHRLLLKEKISIYILICIVLELIEVSTSFIQAAVSIHNIDWLYLFSGGLLVLVTVLVYTVMPVFPVLSVVFAWVDMDMERKKEGTAVVTPPPAVIHAGQPQSVARTPVVQPQPLVKFAVQPPVPPRASAQPQVQAQQPYGRGYPGVQPGNGVRDRVAQQAQRATIFSGRRDEDENGARSLLRDPAKDMASIEIP